MSIDYSNKSFKVSAFNGVIVVVIANVIRQSIGIVSILVLARLLTPDDYGLVAIALLVINFFDVFAQTGANQYVLSRKTLLSGELHTAWTLRVLVRMALAGLIVALSPLLATYFNRAELIVLLPAAALVPLLQAFQSPGLLLMQRELAYRSIAMMTVMAKLVGFVTAISVALATGSYWALVAGEFAFAFSFAIASYWSRPGWPRFSLEGLAGQWNFSRWLVLRAAVGYARAKIDNLIIGRFIGVADLGVYSLSKQLATLPFDHIGAAMTDLLTTSIMQASGDRAKGVSLAFSKILVAQLTVLLPIALALALLADPLVATLLGERWMVAVPILEILSPLMLAFVVTSTTATTLIAVDRARTAFFLDLATATLVIGVMCVLVATGPDLQNFAQARVLLGAVAAVAAIATITMLFQLDLSRLIRSLVPTIGASALMSLIVFGIDQYLLEAPAAARLICATLAGAGAYAVCLRVVLLFDKGRTAELTFLSSLLDLTMSKIGAKFRLTTRKGPQPR